MSGMRSVMLEAVRTRSSERKRSNSSSIPTGSTAVMPSA